MTIPDLGGLDWALLVALLISIVIGFVRGFVFELLSLAGWLAAWVAAQWLSPLLMPVIAAWWPPAKAGVSLHAGAAFALAFVGALLAWALLSRLIRFLIHATPLAIPDRLLGAGFGALRGLVLLLALATVVVLTPASQSAAWRQSSGARWLMQGLGVLKPLLPDAVSRHIPS